MNVGFALNHIDQIINDAPFATHDQIQVAQSHIKIDYHRSASFSGQSHSDGCAGGGFSHAPFA